MKRIVPATLTGLVLLAGVACGGGGGESSGGDGDAAAATGPIDIWYSNNQEEVAWGEAMVEAWNAENPDEQISAQEIPAGQSSEEAIAAAITAGNAPCLIYNTSPAAVPQFQKSGGLVNLDERSRAPAPTSRRGRGTRPSSTPRPTARSTRCRGRPTP